MKTFIGLLIILAFSISGCTQTATPAKTTASKANALSALTKSNANTNTNSQSDTSTDLSASTDSSSNGSSVSTLKDPNAAAGTINQTIGMQSSDILQNANILFPAITFTKTTADFFQVIRCAASYDVVTLQGTSIRNGGNTKFTMDDLKWAWGQALNDSKNCKIVGQYVTNSPYVDLPAPSGAFYYVANPCVAISDSSTGQEGCSYQLSFTKPTIDYENTFIDNLRDLATQYETAQGVLSADLDDLRITAKKFEVALDLCEEYFAFTETEKSLKRGLIALGLNLVGAVAGGVVGGANGAMMVGMLAQAMGGNIINEILGINPSVNTCLYGEGMVSQMGLKTQKDIQRARDTAQLFEDSYHVKAALDHLTQLTAAPSSTNPQGGTLAQDVAALQKIMGQMNAMDQTVIAVTAQIATANKYVAGQLATLNSGTTGTGTSTGP